MKLCTKCGVLQNTDCFVADKRRKDGLYPYCKTCSKEYYQKTRERTLQQKREYAARPDIKEKLSVYCKQRYLEQRELRLSQRKEYYSSIENRKKLLYFKSRERAMKDGIEFSITMEDIVIPENCPYLDIPLTHLLGKGQLPSNSSLDRIDSTKGYIPGNVQVVSRLANTMKSNATPEQLATFAKNVLRIQGSNLNTYIEAICNV